MDQPYFKYALRYSGQLTYAANWNAISQNVGGYQNVPWWNQLDYIGIDAYFPIATQNDTTLAGLTTAWQNRANAIESWRTSRALTNKQVLFTEVGYQSADGSAQSPAGVSGLPTIDLVEQADVYHALLSVMSTKSWWDGAFWWSWDTNQYAGGTNDAGFTPQNKPAQTILQQFYGGPGPPPPPHGAPTQTLFSWESGLEGWQVPSFANKPASLQQSTIGATAGQHSLAVTQTGSGFSWDSYITLTGDQLSAFSLALADNHANYRLEFDVTYNTASIPQNAGVTFLNASVAINNAAGNWTQVDSVAGTNGRTNQTIHVAIPLTSWTALMAGSSSYTIYFAINGNWGSLPATVFFDNLRLVNLSAPLTGDFNHDGTVDAADYTIWRHTLGSSTDLRADGNINGVVDADDYKSVASKLRDNISQCRGCQCECRHSRTGNDCTVDHCSGRYSSAAHPFEELETLTTPKGFHHAAQSWSPWRPTLGSCKYDRANPERVVSVCGP